MLLGLYMCTNAGIDIDSLMECAREGFVQASQREPSAKNTKMVGTC